MHPPKPPRAAPPAVCVTMPPEPAKSNLSRPLLLLSFVVATSIFFARAPFQALTLKKPLRNGPLVPPPPPAAVPTSPLVFNPRTKREAAYLERDFLPDFLSLSVSDFYVVDLPFAKYAYCMVSDNDVAEHRQIIQRLHGDHGDLDNRKAANLDDRYVARVIRDDDFPKYIVVRNPLSRTLAGFKAVEDRMQRIPESQKVEAFHKWVLRLFPPGRSFTAEELDRLDGHWIPQHIHCGMHKARVFKVFQYEQPDAFVSFLEDRVPGSVLQGWGSYQNMSFADVERRRYREVEEFVRYYNDTNVFDRVREFCRRDIEIFGYADQVEEMRQRVLDNIANR